MLVSRRSVCAGLLFGFGGCASLLPNSITLSESDLVALFARQFPTTQRLAEIADVTVASPRLWLIPERNHLGATFDVSAADRLFGRSVQGQLALESGLRFEASDDSLRLAQVKVQQFQLDRGAGGGLPVPAQRVAALIAEHVLEGITVYRLKPNQAQRLHTSGLLPTLSVTSRGVEITLR
jgi:hypothetical protein